VYAGLPTLMKLLVISCRCKVSMVMVAVVVAYGESLGQAGNVHVHVLF
jgi:hypothetical protein